MSHAGNEPGRKDQEQTKMGGVPYSAKKKKRERMAV
jgi:hypothetical protein